MAYNINHFVHLESVDENFSKLEELRAINQEAFPENERLDFDKLLKAASSSDKASFDAAMDGDEAVGFVVSLYNDAYAYVLYFAVDAKQRSNGYGGKTMALIKDKYREKTIFFAIEVLDPASSNYEQRVARKDFYVKNGFYETSIVVDAGKAGKFLLMADKPEIDKDSAGSFLIDVLATGEGISPDEFIDKYLS